MADVNPMLPFHVESDVELNAPANAVLSHLDSRLSAHMSRPSWIMVGSRMAIELDGSKGRTVGVSSMEFSGRRADATLDRVGIQNATEVPCFVDPDARGSRRYPETYPT